MMHHHMLRDGFMVYYHRLGGRYHQGLVGYTASIMAQTQGKVIAAAESYHYYAGHQEHFKHILFHNFEDRGLCLYKNEAHQKKTFI